MNQLSTAANVQRINVSNINTDINLFLGRYKSKSTKRDYLRNIKEFFQFVQGKSLEELKRQDVECILEDGQYRKLLNKDVEQYKNFLKDKHPNSEGSVICKMYSIRSLYKFFEINDYKVNPKIFDVQFLKSKPTSYGILSTLEVLQLSELCKEERYDGEELSVFVLLTAVTSNRATAMLNLTWDNVAFSESSQLYTATTLAKRDETVTSPFEKELYDMMLLIKVDGENRVFPNLKLDKVNKTIQRIVYSKMRLSEKRNITTHSLRKTAPDFEMKDTGDIKAGMAQTGHKSVQTYMDHYTDQTADYGNRAGIRMMKKVDESVFDLVDKGELLALLKESNVNAYNQLCIKLMGIVGV